MEYEHPLENEFNEVAQENAEKVRAKILKMQDELGALPAYKITNDFAQKLRKDYEEAGQYLLYHALIGSDRNIPKLKYDFDGEDSIAKFILEDGYKEVTK